MLQQRNGGGVLSFPKDNNWHFCLWSSVWSLWTLAQALHSTLVKHMMPSLHSCPTTSPVSPLTLYSHKRALSCTFWAISSLNIPRDIHLILTSSVQLTKCRLENKWQTPKQINYVSTKLLACMHRAGAGNKSWAHTAIWRVWERTSYRGCSGTAQKFSHIFMSRSQKISNICHEMLENETIRNIFLFVCFDDCWIFNPTVTLLFTAENCFCSKLLFCFLS